jgi:hypothetical protein
MRIKRISGALLISLVFHLIVIFFIGIRLVNQEQQQFKSLVGVEMFSAPEAPKAKLRKPIVKYLRSTPNAPLSTVVTHANQPISNSPSSVVFSGPAASAPATVRGTSTVGHSSKNSG